MSNRQAKELAEICYKLKVAMGSKTAKQWHPMMPALEAFLAHEFDVSRKHVNEYAGNAMKWVRNLPEAATVDDLEKHLLTLAGEMAFLDKIGYQILNSAK